MLKAFKYRIYPTEQQKILLEKHFGVARFVYNWGLAKKTQAYQLESKNLSCFSLTNEITQLKKTPEYEWLREVNAQSIQMSLRNLDNAYTNFFRKKIGFPKFKSKRKSKPSFQCPQSVRIDGNKIILPKFSEGIKIKLHRNFNGLIKTTTISKTSTGKYYASILVETTDIPIDKKPIVEDTVLGIDFGVKQFATLSDGRVIENPRHLTKSLKKLKSLGRRHSRKVKGSNNRNKSRHKLAVMYEKVTNQRNDFLHKTSYMLVSENQTSAIAIEDLSITNMVSQANNSNISRSILDVGWFNFTTMLKYKSDWYGKHLIKIGRFEPSSKLCSSCGVINNELTLNQRTWQCDCGAVHDRDLLAANNIKHFATQKQNLIGMDCPELTLVESSR